MTSCRKQFACSTQQPGVTLLLMVHYILTMLSMHSRMLPTVFAPPAVQVLT